MANLRHCLVLAMLCGLSYGLSEITTPKPEIIPIPSKLPTETPSPDTTTSSTTTTPPPTTTTPPPTTTTPPPTTTTPPTTTSTTPKPTTTPVPPSPPAPPKPLPPPDTGSWSYKDNATNITCIVVEFAAALNVTYTKVKNDTSISSFVLLNIPANATVVTGSCNTTEQWLTLSWPTSNDSQANNTLTMAFHQNQTTKDYALKNLNISLTADNFVDPLSKDPIVVYHGAEWQTPLASSYRCKMATRLNMSSEAAGNVVARLTISNLQEEAFRTAPGTGFSAARDCGGGDIPDAVPIAVGCALGGLVVVVLVAYLVGRRRSAARGYLSM